MTPAEQRTKSGEQRTENRRVKPRRATTEEPLPIIEAWKSVPLTTDPQVIALIREADELVAIFIASAKTAKGR